jgi:hypothetical protein
MILRRISEAFRKQDWFTVAIETLIVVLGVFVGLQVNNWNTSRQDRALELSFIDRISVDMANSLQDRQEDAKWDRERLRTQKIVLAALRSGELAPSDRVDFDTGLLLFGYVSEPRVRWATVRELESTGGTSLIRDVALRDAIGRMQSEIIRRGVLSDNLTSAMNALRERIADRFEVIDFDFESERASTLNYDFAVLAADTEFLNLLSQIDYYTRTKVSNSDNLAAAAETLRIELERQLGEDPEQYDP